MEKGSEYGVKAGSFVIHRWCIPGIVLFLVVILGVLYSLPHTGMRKPKLILPKPAVRNVSSQDISLPHTGMRKPKLILQKPEVRNASSQNVTLDSKPSVPRAGKRYNLTVDFMGQLGNCIFEYAVVWATAELNGMNFVMPKKPDIDLYKVFDLEKRPVADLKTEADRYPRHWGYSWACYEKERMLNIHKQKSNIALRGFFQSFKYFDNIKERLRKELTFLPHIKSKGKDFVEKLKPGVWANKKVVKVGIHVRRGDAIAVRAQEVGRANPSPAFYDRARNYMKKRYHNVLFIVTSDDIKWAMDNFGNDSIVYSEGLSGAEDLALLASCDHVIAPSSSFSWWAAWLANGTTIYYEHFPRPGSSMAKGFCKEDYYPPEWIPML